jgi:hypothetical protein
MQRTPSSNANAPKTTGRSHNIRKRQIACAGSRLIRQAKNYSITNTNGAPLTFTNPADSSIRTVPTKTANYAADRFTVTLQEIRPPLTGRDCSFSFRIVSIKQITESRFLLPAVPVPAAQLGNPAAGPFFGVVSSPLEPIDPLFGDGAVLTLPISPANCLSPTIFLRP